MGTEESDHRKIALEEHYTADADQLESLLRLTGMAPEYFSTLRRQLLDLGKERLEQMDRGGIAVSILSLNAPGVQAIAEPRAAVEAAHRYNDALAEQVAEHPDRFRGFAALPLQDPDAAVAELHRCVEQLGMVGTMINGYTVNADATGVYYYDEPRFAEFWGELEALRAPAYLHPTNPPAGQREIYQGHEWMLGPVWGFHVQAGSHALRLMGSGLFDRHPDLRMILGHMGELLPFQIWRVDHRLSMTDPAANGVLAERPLSHYLAENFYLTISGNYDLAPFMAAVLKVGTGRILYSVDYPFESVEATSAWLDDLPISADDRRKIGYENAKALFRLS